MWGTWLVVQLYTHSSHDGLEWATAKCEVELRLGLGFFFAYEVEIGAYVEEVDADGDDVPEDYGAGGDQEAVEDPEDLEDAHDQGHLWVDAGAGTALEHLEQVGKGGERGAESGDEADDLRAFNMGIEQAGPVVGHETAAAAKQVDAESESSELQISQSRHRLGLSFNESRLRTEEWENFARNRCDMVTHVRAGAR